MDNILKMCSKFTYSEFEEMIKYHQFKLVRLPNVGSISKWISTLMSFKEAGEHFPLWFKTKLVLHDTDHKGLESYVVTGNLISHYLGTNIFLDGVALRTRLSCSISEWQETQQ